MNIQFFHVDAFTDVPFHGNPAGVCILDQPLVEELMQVIAMEINLPETAFIHPTGNGYTLRWFTPLTELPLCGHGTIASAHILWEERIAGDIAPIVFNSKNGKLTVRKSDLGWIEMDFPAYTMKCATLPEELKSLFPDANSVFYGNDRYLVELSCEKEVREFIPNFHALKNHRVVITAKGAGDSNVDFVSRYFGVPVGVPEDPVTGSAHCLLGPFWAARLKKNDLKAFQASPRGGHLVLQCKGDRVLISGKAITIFKGNLFINKNASQPVHLRDV